MIIEADSPLRNLPLVLNPRQVLLLDGIRYSAEMADIAYSRLFDTLTYVSKNHNSNEFDFRVFPHSFLDAWSVIDSVNRLRTLLVNLTGYKKILKEESKNRTTDGIKNEVVANGNDEIITLKIFFEETKKVQLLRNMVQHLEGRLDHVLSLQKTIWGSLDWVYVDERDEELCHVFKLVAGSITKIKEDYINPTGDIFHSRLDRITLCAHDLDICLTSLLKMVEKSIRNIEEQIQPQFEIHKKGRGDMLSSIDIRFGKHKE